LAQGEEEDEDVEIENKTAIEDIRAKFATKFEEIEAGVTALSNFFEPASLKEINGAIKAWEKLKGAFDKKYEAAKAKAKVNQQQLDQIQAV
jgi:hypothetical protein